MGKTVYSVCKLLTLVCFLVNKRSNNTNFLKLKFCEVSLKSGRNMPVWIYIHVGIRPVKQGGPKFDHDGVSQKKWSVLAPFWSPRCPVPDVLSRLFCPGCPFSSPFLSLHLIHFLPHFLSLTYLPTSAAPPLLGAHSILSREKFVRVHILAKNCSFCETFSYFRVREIEDFFLFQH